MRLLLIALSVLLGSQDPALQQTRAITAVRTALIPALPFPDSDEAGALPANGDSEAPWMVRPLQSGDRSIEVIANPLNEVNQLRAARAMAQIENNIQSAQRRAEVQFDRALAEAKRTGKSQEVDGVTLADEGVAGAKIDADSHVTIDVLFNEPRYQFTIAAQIEPARVTTVPVQNGMVYGVPAHIYQEPLPIGDRYSEKQYIVFLGAVSTPQVTKRDGHVFEVTAAPAASPNAPAASMVVRLRGNDVLLNDLLAKTNWNGLLELLK